VDQSGSEGVRALSDGVQLELSRALTIVAEGQHPNIAKR
jgi:hypothetical protein